MLGQNTQGSLDKGRQWEVAAQLLADGASWRAVQEELGISSAALTNWSRDPAFARLVDQAQQQRVTLLAHRGIAARANQLEALQADWERMELILRERSQDPRICEAAGGASGLILRKSRAQPTGNYTVKEVFDDTFDQNLFFARLKLMEYVSRVAGWAQPTAPDLDAIREETRKMAEKAGLSDEDTRIALAAAERLVRERRT